MIKRNIILKITIKKTDDWFEDNDIDKEDLILYIKGIYNMIISEFTLSDIEKNYLKKELKAIIKIIDTRFKQNYIDKPKLLQVLRNEMKVKKRRIKIPISEKENNNIKTYTLTTELPCDFDRFEKILIKKNKTIFSVKKENDLVINGIIMPSTVSFNTYMCLHEIKQIMRKVRDGHIMLRSIREIKPGKFDLKYIIDILKNEFSNTIDKSELVQTLNERYLENKLQRIPTPYQLFVFEQYGTDEIKGLPNKERFAKIAEKWKTESKKLKNDTDWFNKVLKEREDKLKNKMV